MVRDASRPRLAFVGLGWIGRHRLEAALRADVMDVIALSDADVPAVEAAGSLVPAAARVSFEEALAMRPDGVVLATPSAMHAEQSIRALETGAAVFCQKPLGRNASEVQQVIEVARRRNRLLGVDLSYRHTAGLRRIRELIREGAIGETYAVDLTFHNAYGPDKAWFYDIAQSGGGCLLDLGVHLIDFVHWTFDEPAVDVRGHRFANGKRLEHDARKVEDYAVGEIELASGTIVRIACSWKLPAGCDAQIGVFVYGTGGGFGFRNVGGSFYDFVAECYRGTETQVIASPPDDWGGRAIVAWCQALARSSAFDAEIEIVGRDAATLDALYGRSEEEFGRGSVSRSVPRSSSVQASSGGGVA